MDFGLLTCSAQLTATVHPGHTFKDGERPTTETLNLAANPTVEVSGTLGGTNVGLAAGSVSGTMLQASVVDDTSIEFFSNGGNTSMRVKAYGVSSNNVSSNLLGLGLTGASGTNINVKVDGTNLFFNAAGSITLSNVVTTNITIAAATTYNVAHGMATTPRSLRWVLVNTTAESGFVEGDEIAPEQVLANGGSSGPYYTLFSGGANATNLFFTVNANAGGYNLVVVGKNSGANSAFTLSKWKAKAYARP